MYSIIVQMKLPFSRIPSMLFVAEVWQIVPFAGIHLIDVDTIGIKQSIE